MLNKIKYILKLPKVSITLVERDSNGKIREIYENFNKHHSKYKIIRNKTIGVMLYELPKNVLEYEKLITGKNSTSYFARRCKKKGYYTKYFIQREHLEELYEINTSATQRQGRKMSDHYLQKVEPEEKNNYSEYYGIFSNDNILVGYINLIKTDNLFIISQLLGHKDYLNDNIMYLMLHDLTEDLINKNKDCKETKFLMYDTYFGGSEGIKLFKKRNCFTPYKVKWKYENKK